LPSLRTSLALLCACALPASLCAQATPAGGVTASATTNDEGPAGIIPFVKGPNLSLATTSQHDSANGWSSLLTPDFAWRFDKHFAADTSLPIYDYINVVVTGGAKAKPTYTNATKNHALGDMALNGHFDASLGWLDYNGALTLGVPTGNKDYGLGAGKPTYNFNNHFEKDFDIFSPDIEIGIGDASDLVGPRVQKSYVSVGELAHFQAGTSVELPWKMTFDTEAYEELPISSQTLYSTTGKGKKKVTTATNAGVAEDNGFTNSLDIRLNGHVTLSGFYNRSLRAHIDTVGFSFTFLLKAPPPAAR
jgi:hypothetical protein